MQTVRHRNLYPVKTLQYGDSTRFRENGYFWMCVVKEFSVRVSVQGYAQDCYDKGGKSFSVNGITGLPRFGCQRLQYFLSLPTVAELWSCHRGEAQHTGTKTRTAQVSWWEKLSTSLHIRVWVWDGKKYFCRRFFCCISEIGTFARKINSSHLTFLLVLTSVNFISGIEPFLLVVNI